MASPTVVDALLDAVDAKAAFAKRRAETIVDVLHDDIVQVVLVAARAKARDSDVQRTLVKLRARRKELLARAVMVVAADRLAERTLVTQAKAVERAGKHKRIGPIRRKDLEARRAVRTDGGWRLDRIGDEEDMPELAELAGMSEARLRRTLQQLGVTVDEESMLVNRIASAAHRLIGADRPTDALIEQVIQTAERQVRGQVITLTKEAIRERHMAKLVTHRGMMLLWISYLDEATCEDCESDERHNASHTMAEWERLGLPGSRNLRCNGRCRCEIVPDDWFMEADPDATGDISVEITTRLVA